MTACSILLFTSIVCWDPLDWFELKDFKPHDTGTSGHKHDARVSDFLPCSNWTCIGSEGSHHRGVESNMTSSGPLPTIFLFKSPEKSTTSSKAPRSSVPSSISLSSASGFCVETRTTALEKTKNAVLPGLGR